MKKLEDFAKFGKSVCKNFDKYVLVGEKVAFEHKFAFGLISLTFIQAKWTKSKPTFVQTFNNAWR